MWQGSGGDLIWAPPGLFLVWFLILARMATFGEVSYIFISNIPLLFISMRLLRAKACTTKYLHGKLLLRNIPLKRPIYRSCVLVQDQEIIEGSLEASS